MTADHFKLVRISLTGNRKNNQDRCIILSKDGTTLLALADGLGGHPRGEVAAQLFIDICESRFRQAQTPLADPEAFMTDCLQKAHKAILQYGGRQAPPILPRTTAVITIIQHSTAHWMHVGDSRFYLIRKGHLLAQTRDHSRVRLIRPSDGASSKLRSSITQCLGGEIHNTSITSGPATKLEAEDRVLLCSDGLWGQVPQKEIIESISVDTNFEASLNLLCKEAAMQGYPRSDNISLIALRWVPHSPLKPYTHADPLEKDHQLTAAVKHLKKLLRNNS